MFHLFSLILFKRMRCGLTNLLRVTGITAFVLSGAGHACRADDENPYHAIVDRNVFDLKAPPPPAPPKETEAPKPPPNIKFTGTTSIFGKTRALFMVQEAATPGKPGAGGPPKEESVILKVGDRQGGLELLEVDEEKGTAKIKNNGEEVVLTLPLGPAAGGGAPPPGGAPGIPHNPGPGGQPGIIPNQNLGGQFRPPTFIQPQAIGTPGTTMGSGLNPAISTPSASAMGLDAGLGGIPGRDLRTAAAQQPAGPASIEEAALLLEANRKFHANNPNMPPLPPPMPGMGSLTEAATTTTPSAPSMPTLPPQNPWNTRPNFTPTVLPQPGLPR